jgi:hypothetical protein
MRANSGSDAIAALSGDLIGALREHEELTIAAGCEFAQQKKPRTGPDRPEDVAMIGIGARWPSANASPATPPGVRVRAGRFDGLRSTGEW